jgi:menaquinol-cytochrome c reductase iron-sulfur subunit
LDQSEHDPKTHAPGHSLWPIGFAISVAVALVGLLVSWWIVGIGCVLLVFFGAAWAYDVSREHRPKPVEPPTPPKAGEQIARAPVGEQPATRKGFLGAMTLGLGAAIGAIVTIPPLVFAGVPPFRKGEGFTDMHVDLGPLENFKVDQWFQTSFNIEPLEGDVADRTAYIRYNGLLPDPETKRPEPSFTILSSRCVHLGCPVQANGPRDDKAKQEMGAGLRKVTMTPVLPAGGFGCPCHGGQYSSEGNRTAGPPVRALDRYAYEVRDGKLYLVGMFSVNEVEGTGKDAVMGKYRLAAPGIHIDGVEQILYPFIPPS